MLNRWDFRIDRARGEGGGGAGKEKTFYSGKGFIGLHERNNS